MTPAQVLLALLGLLVVILVIASILVAGTLVGSILRHPFRRDDAHVARRFGRRALAEQRQARR